MSTLTTHLDPLIIQKLQAFAKRRRKLIVIRGVCAALAMLLATMMAVALVDTLFTLEDWARWTLSGVAYAAVLIAEWRACLRLLVHMPDPRRVARLIEHAEPKLREDLLSAVELGQGDAAFDSEQFRQLVQSDVAARMEKVDIDRLLPVNLVKRSLAIVSAIAVICIASVALTGFQFGTSMLRALLPMLNLAKVSKVKVAIVEPNPADEIVAQGDAVPLMIEISGQRTNKAVLEIFTKSGGRELVQMSPAGNDRFSSTVQVAREDVEYRIRAGDAMTRKYHLQAAARPTVVRFDKTYRFPAYTKLEPKHVTEESGDLAGLEQTQVDLQLETDQPVKTAELRVEKGKVNTVIPLATQPNGHFTATVPLDKSGIYRVHLVAAKTGFENKFSPEYELRADPDLVPQVELETPQHDLILPANEILSITGNATDDLAVERVEQQFRVNGGTWTSIPIAAKGGPKVRIENRWDLLQQGLRAGDTITTKLVAFDQKNNRGESRPVQITLTAAGFEMKRLQALETESHLFDALTALRTAVEALEKQGGDSRDQFARLPENDPQRKQATVSFTAALDEYERKEVDTANQLTATLRGAAPVHMNGDLVMLGRLLSKATAGSEQTARDNMNLVAADPSAPTARDLVREAADSSGRAAGRVRLAQESLRTFLASEEIDVLNENMQVVSQEQDRIAALAANNGDDTTKWAQLSGRMRVVLTEARSLETLITTASTHANNYVDRLRHMQRLIDDHCAAVDKLLANANPGKELLDPTNKLRKTLEDVRRGMLEMRSSMADSPVHAMTQLTQELQPAWAYFEKLRQDNDATMRNDKLSAENRVSLATSRWVAKSNVFKANGDFEEARSDADTYYVNDVRMVTLALEALKGQVMEEHVPSPEWDKSIVQINTLDQAFRVLESGHTLSEVVTGLDHLTASERWEFASLRSRTSDPRDWRWLDTRLHALPDELGRTQLTNQDTRKIIQKVQQILWDIQRDQMRVLSEEMNQRFKIDRAPVAVPTELQRLAARVREALELLRKPMEDARAALAQMAPKLSEIAKELAKEADQLKKESEEHAKEAGAKPPEEAQAAAKKELAAQQQLNDKVEALKDALRADAGTQDLLKQEGREHARDVDDALAMLKDPPPRSEQALADATKAERTAEQQDAMRAAANEQQKMADALNQVSNHFDALEKGENPDQTRLALREAEKALGVKDELDQQYANAEQLAAMSGKSAEEMLKQLEKELPKNPVMQQELSAISQAALTSANTKLAEATNKENAVANDVKKLADQQRQQAEAQQAQQPDAQAQPNGQQQPNGQSTAQNANQQNAQNAGQQNMAQNSQTPQANQSQPSGQQQATAQNQNQNQGQQPQTGNQPQGQQANAANQPQGAQAAQNANPQLAQAAKQQPQIGQAANQAASDIQRAGRHEERLQNTTTGQQLQQLGQQVQQTAENQVPKAQDALNMAQNAAQAQQPVDTANHDLQGELAQLNQSQGSQQAQAGQQQAQAGQQQAQAGQQQAQAGQQQAQAGQQQAQAGQQQAQAGQQQAQAGQQQAQAGQQQAQAGQMAAAQATPEEQTWMARTLDALDAALHAPAPAAAAQQGAQGSQQQGAQSQSGQQQQAQANQGQQGQQQGQPNGQQQQGQANAASDAMAQAQQAMSAAAQANAASLRSSRTQNQSAQPNGTLAQGEQQAASKGGVNANAGQTPRSAVPELKAAQVGDWGKLPKKVAEQLSQGQQEGVAGEYRNQVQTYYRVIAERAKKE